MHIAKKRLQFARRVNRTRTKVKKRASGLPRLSVHRTNLHIYAQIIDDVKGVTLASASDFEVKGSKNKTEAAAAVGKLIAEKAAKAKVTRVVFDRGGFAYHGRVKALCDAAREHKLSI